VVKAKLYRMSHEQREQIAEEISALLETRPEVRFAYLFGSFHEGGPFHDIDVGVYLNADDRAGEPMPELVLAAALTARLRLPVDVRVLNRAPIPFAYQVLRGRLLFERDADEQERFASRIVMRSLDMKPLLRRAAKETFGR